MTCPDPGVPVHGPSGASAHLRGVVRALQALGHEVRLAAFRLTDHRGSFGRPLELPTVIRPPRPWRWLPPRFRERGEWLDARRLVREALKDGWRPDLVWQRHSLFSDPGELGVPLLLELNAPLSLERRARDPVFGRAVERRVLRRAHRVFAVSRWLVDWAVGLGCAPERVRHLPNGTDLPPGDRARGRSARGLNGLVLGFVGSMKPWHGLDRLPALLDALPDATCLSIGTGPVRTSHPRLVATGHLEGQELADAIAALDVGLVPYTAHSPPWFCPLKVLDYRSQGVPVVAADIGDTRELVGMAGELLPPTAEIRDWALAVRRQALRRPEPTTRTWEQVMTDALAEL